MTIKQNSRDVVLDNVHENEWQKNHSTFLCYIAIRRFCFNQ